MSKTTPKITLSGPAELLTVLPYQLGFEPARSVVLACFHRRRLGLVVRLDAAPRSVAGAVAEQLLPALARERPASVAVLCFEEDAGETAPLADALEAAAARIGVPVQDRLVARGGRWFTVGCDCCPVEGRPLPDPADVPAVAAYVALGHAVLPSRDHLEALVEPLSPRDGDGTRYGLLDRAVDDWRSQRLSAGPSPRLDDDALDDALGAWADVLSGECAGHALRFRVPALVAALRDVVLRDALVAWLCPQALPLEALPPRLVERLVHVLGASTTRLAGVRPVAEDGTDDWVDAWVDDGTDGGDDDEADDWVEAWVDDGTDGGADDGDVGPEEWAAAEAPGVVLDRIAAVCRETPDRHAAPVLALYASVAWWSGDGARAGTAVDRALELEPEHRLARLLRQTLDHGVRPRSCA